MLGLSAQANCLASADMSTPSSALLCTACTARHPLATPASQYGCRRGKLEAWLRRLRRSGDWWGCLYKQCPSASAALALP